MKRHKILKLFLMTLSLILSAYLIRAQPLVISGKVSAAGGHSLPSASIKLLSPQDSSVIASSATNLDGEFLLSDSVRKHHYILQASFIGYKIAYNVIEVNNAVDTLAIGAIQLHERAIRLEAVTIAEKRDPIVIKQDTVEYRAEAFPTLAHAKVESLLKKVPGLDVARDGTITAGGEEISRIFVNGKEVFGNNLQLITKNLPAEAVDKIQVIDDKSDAQRFSFAQSASTSKAINLEIKESHQGMVFGNVSAGMSDEHLYAGSGNLNLFNDGDQLNVIGKSNNVNNQDPMAQDERSNISDSEPGMTTSHSGAVNFVKALSEKVSVNGSYHSLFTDNRTETSLTRQLFHPEGVASYSENSTQQMEMLGHQASAGLQFETQNNTLKVTATGNLSNVNSSGSVDRESLSSDQSNGYVGERTYTFDNVSMNGTLLGFYGHKFKKKGRAITINGQFSALDNKLQNENANLTTFRDGTSVNNMQRNDQSRTTENYSITLSYTEPIGKKQQINADYSFSNRSAKSNDLVFDIFEGHESLNGELSNDLNSGFIYHRAGLSYQLNATKYTLTLGSVVQQAELSRKSYEETEAIKQSFENILPHAILSVKLSDYSKLNVQYNALVREPSLNELQPIESQNDPVNLFLPNATLRPEYVHQGRVNYNTSSRRNRSVYFSISANGSYTKNPITRAVTISDNQTISTQFINTSHAKRLSANVQTAIPLRKLNSSFKLGPFATYHTTVAFLNGLQSPQTQYSYGTNVTYSFTYKKALDLNASGYYSTNVSEIAASNATPQIFIQKHLTLDGTWHFLKRLSLAAAFSYQNLKNEAINFDEYFPMLNFSFAISLFKNKNGQIVLAGNNVLDQTATGTQTSTSSYVEQRTNTTILGRFFMAGFTYHFNKRPEQ